jgi:hypothetical protein
MLRVQQFQEVVRKDQLSARLAELAANPSLMGYDKSEPLE